MPTLPYLTTPGNLSKAFTAIQSAATPDKVSQDYVKTILGIPGGSGDSMTTFLRRIGFVTSDGKPSDLYRQFRNPETAGQAVAKAMRQAYHEIFKRNEFAYNLSDDEIKGHIIEITGNPADSRSVQLILSTFKNMKSFADFFHTEEASTEINPIGTTENSRNAESLGCVDKRDSHCPSGVIQAGICDGDQLGTRPDVGRGMGVL